MSQDTEQSQQSPREIAEKLHRKIKRLIDADRQHYEPSGLYEIVTWIATAIEAERESLAAKDREIAGKDQRIAELERNAIDFQSTINRMQQEEASHCQLEEMILREKQTQIAALQEENAKDLAGMREFQRKFIEADQGRRLAEKQRDALVEAMKRAKEIHDDCCCDEDPPIIDSRHRCLYCVINAALASVDEQKQQEQKNVSDQNAL